jgi:N-acetylglutamate synthase-like GNAT family acetyltransferase
MIIRRAQASDAKGIHEAHMLSIQEVCAKDYTDAEIQAWGHRPFSDYKVLNSIEKDFFWVIADKEKIEGFGHLKIWNSEEGPKAEVMGLYLTPRVLGQGFGRKIIELMLSELRTQKVKSLTLSSTITSVPFYEKMGFIKLGGLSSHPIRGVAVRCQPMQMQFQ